MTSSRHARRALLCLVAVLLTCTGLLTSLPARADEAPKVLLLLDVSGSMNEKISGGGTKFAAAQRALKQVASSLPPGTQVGLRVYGSTISEPKSQNPKACTDSELVLPIGPLDQAKMNRAVDSFSPKGETPIAYSLGKAVGDLGDSGKRVLILISDGQETCNGDPCPVAKKLADKGVDLQFNAIGLAVNGTARKQLQCIAKAGDGSYYDANNTDSLNDSLRKLTQRALRPFEVAGMPVVATKDPAAAPKIGPGQYRDRYDASGTPRYYTIDRTPGGLVTASVSTVVHQVENATNYEQFTMTLSTMDDQQCAEVQRQGAAEYASIVYGAAVRSSGSGNTGTLPDGCTNDPQLRLAVSRHPTGNQAGSGTVPVELLIASQPPVTNRDSLPENVSDYAGTGKAVPATSPKQATVGGSGFSNAAEIGAGTWTDSVAFGETVLYKVHLDYGQSVNVTGSVPGGGSRPTTSQFDQWFTRLALISPARVTLTQQQQGGAGNKPATRLTVDSPQVRVRNDELPLSVTQSPYSPDASTASVSGDYFVALELEPVASPQLKGVVIPVQLDVAVNGTPSGQPAFAAGTTPSPSDSATPSATPTAAPARGGSGTGSLVLGLGIGFVVAAAAAVVVVLALRRRGPRA